MHLRLSIYIHLSNLIAQIVVYTIYEICQMLIYQPWTSDDLSQSPSNILASFLSRPMDLATYVLEQAVCYLLDLSEYVSLTCIIPNS